MFFFFFSSRRRHTRSLCDWSSDVCSFRSGVAVTRLRVAPFLGAEDGRLLLRLAQEDYSLRLPEVLQRSEEHTSELQSHSDLVCRLLLEKKKGSDRSCSQGDRGQDKMPNKE